MSYRNPQPDKGFSWVILCASFLNYTLVSGTIRTFGILYAELLQVHGRGAGDTAFIGSLLFFVMAMVGPITGIASVYYSFRWCTIIGGLFAGMGMILSSFTTSIEMLFLTYSCIIGIGLGLSSPLSITIINFYFEKKRAFANGVLTASMGLASLVYPVLYRKLIDEYGIRGAMLILGGILLNICVGGSLFRQPKCFVRPKSKNIENSNGLMTEPNLKLEIGNFSRIKSNIIETLRSYKAALNNISFNIYCVALSFALVGYSSNFNILPPHIESQNFSKVDVVIVISVIGGTEFIARFLTGSLLDLHHFTVQTMFIITMFAGGLCAIVLTFFRSMTVNIVYAVTVGIFPGVLHSITPLLLVSILGLKALPYSLPVLRLFTSSACLIGHPFLGWLEDWTGNWKASFYTMGGLFITSSLCVILERNMCRSSPIDFIEVDTKEEQKDVAENETSAMIPEDNIP